MVRSGPALFTGYHQAGAVGARSCVRPQVRSPGGSRAPRRRCAAPPSDRECAARLASPLAQTVGWFGWPSVGRAGPSAPLLLPGCSPAGRARASCCCCEACQCQVASGSRGPHRHRSPARDQCARVPMAITRACGVQRARLLRTCRDRAAIIRAGLGHGGVE